jgi:EpsD family peptidyl-prolyl cis-trans isomerase
MRGRPLLAVALPLCLALAAGCGSGEQKKVVSQVAVKVNSDEITVHQVNAALTRARQLASTDPARAKRDAVERLVVQELARQQAIVKKLDRSPEVVRAMEAARAEILARAYLQHVAAAQPAPTPEEVQKYYAEHSALFAERRLYALEEISFEPRADLGEALRQRLAGASSLKEVADWLGTQEVRFSVSRGSRAAEQVPLEMLPVLKDMQAGEMRLVELDGRAYVIRLVAAKPAPIDEQTARPRIEQFLANRRAGEAMTAELKRLRTQAKIEYVGEFRREASGGQAAAAQQVNAPQDDSAANYDEAVRALR